MINATNLYLQYGDRVLLDRVSFTIGVKDRLGLVGRNGAGKSTILKIISGMQQPDEGNIARPSTSTLGFLHQDMLMPQGKTVIEEALSAFEEARKVEEKLEKINAELNVRTDYETDAFMDLLHEQADLNDQFQMLGGHSMQADAERVLGGLGFKQSELNRLTTTFSGGWQMRIELAKMLLRQPDFLLLDEPTNHLDIESIIWLEEFLSTYPGAIIIISHDKQFLDNTTTRTMELELGKIHDYKANYSKYLIQRVERRELMQNAYENQQRVLADKQKTIDRFMAKATKTSMAQSMQKQLNKIERIEMEDEDVATMNIRFPPAPRSGQIAVEASDIVKKYGENTVLNKIDLKLDRGDRVAFVGQNGQGKTTLAKILVGVEPSTDGHVFMGHNVQIGYYAQNQAEALQGNLTLLQTMEQSSPPELRPRLRAILGAFMFTGPDADKRVSVLSGGERARLALACLLLKPFNLLLLDEPTNHLDIKSKEVLKQALLQYDGTLIVVSHDRDFLTGLGDRTIEFRDGKLYDYLGDVNYFLEKRKLDNLRDASLKSTQSPSSAANKPAPVESSLSMDEKRENEKLVKKLQRLVQISEAEIAKSEAKLRLIEQEMGEPSFYNKPNAQFIVDNYNQLKAELDTILAQWEEQQEALDNALALS